MKAKQTRNFIAVALVDALPATSIWQRGGLCVSHNFGAAVAGIVREKKNTIRPRFVTGSTGGNSLLWGNCGL
jgi:hypothetical protein